MSTVMSTNSTNILKSTAQRLGITSEFVLKKAEEYLRVFNSKAGTLKTLNDVARAVLCLDLACTSQGDGFDKETALRLSGLKKTPYQNQIHTIKKILELDKSLSIAELCIQLSCITVRDLAEDIFNKYKSSDNKIKDFNHPQHAVAAIYTACKIRNVKVDKAAFTAASHLKPVQWKEFAAEFATFADKNGIGAPSKIRKKELFVRLKLVDENIDEQEKCTKNDEKVGEIIEEYEVWKQRILNEAYAAIGISTK